MHLLGNPSIIASWRYHKLAAMCTAGGKSRLVPVASSGTQLFAWYLPHCGAKGTDGVLAGDYQMGLMSGKLHSVQLLPI